MSRELEENSIENQSDYLQIEYLKKKELVVLAECVFYNISGQKLSFAISMMDCIYITYVAKYVSL